MKNFGKLTLMCGLAAVSLVAPLASADIVLTDGNSKAVIDPGNQAGVKQWTVDGMNQLFQQWFWYRIGNTAEKSIDTISAPSVSVIGTDEARITYSAGNLEIRVTYTLTGGTNGSDTSDIGELIRITNRGTSSMDFHFFQYSDFDLDGTIGGDKVSLVNANTWDQTDVVTGLTLSETTGTPAASHSEAGLFSSTLNRLNDGVATTLNDITSAGIGDATWAWQWDVNIAAGGSFIISKDKHFATASVPAPGATLLLGLGLGLVGWVKRRLA